MAVFNEIKVDKIKGNIFDMIGREWMLITAGDADKFNTMTASWGSAGILWGKPVTFSFVRPQRYTYQFLNNYNYYTLSFYDEGYRDALNYCGSHSGRDSDKVRSTGLTPVFDGESVYFDEAKLVLVCRKLYVQDINRAGFFDEEIAATYHEDDLHRMYVGEIEKVLAKQ